MRKKMSTNKKNKLNRDIIAIQRTTERLEKSELKDHEKKGLEMALQNYQNNLDNIDEVTTIEIGAATNSLIKGIQTAYSFHLPEYWRNFEEFVDKYVTGLTSDGNLKNGSYFGKQQCYELGLSKSDLLCFKGNNPMNTNPGDIFRQNINVNYGTNIPMSGIEQQALQEYESAVFSGDDVAKDQAMIKYKEIQRDAGSLKIGPEYHPLATDQNYQEAINRVSGRTF